MSSILDRVIECIAVTTRYPRHILTPHADLENDLGIDSVKRVEIVTAIADEFQLDLINKERDPAIRTIDHVAAWIDRELNAPALQDGTAAPQANAEPTTSPYATADTGTAGSSPAARDRHQPTSLDRGSDSPPHRSGGHERFDPPHTVAAESHRRLHDNSTNAGPRPAPARVRSTENRSLAGRLALVTGSGRGVGRTTARLLAARGATVLINSFHSRELGEAAVAEISAAGGQAVHLWGSVANPDQVDVIFNEIERQFGYLDILVCNASDGRLGSFTDISQADWDCAFHTNVTGHYQCAMRARHLMQRRGGGSIITMSSIAAHRYVQGLGGQGVIKAAVEAMTRNLACELAPYGVRANCVSGGAVYGDVMSQYEQTRATFNYWESIAPDGQLCSPLDLASTIAFLVSDEARAINGAVFTVDHGASTRAHSRPLPQANQAAISAPLHS